VFHAHHRHHFGNSKLKSVGPLATPLKIGERGNLEDLIDQVAVIEPRKLPDMVPQSQWGL